MALPLNAKVEATSNFLANLDAAHQFFQAQDAEAADTRLGKLKEDLRQMVASQRSACSISICKICTGNAEN